jgi:hypothetical protein
MRTEAQIQASRLNGAKSRGPVTAEGKLASSQNAVKHGMLSAAVLIAGENEQTFNEFAASLYDEFQPATPFEASLVDAMAAARWRHARIGHIEKATFNLNNQREREQFPATSQLPETVTARSFSTLANDTRTLDLINRYESRYDRQYLRAHKRLLEVQDRKKSVPAASVSAGPVAESIPPTTPTVSPATPTLISAKRTQRTPNPTAALSRRSYETRRLTRSWPFTQSQPRKIFLTPPASDAYPENPIPAEPDSAAPDAIPQS